VIPGALKQSVVLKNCVAFVGAGFSKLAGMPSWKELLETLWEHAIDQSAQVGISDGLSMCKQCIDASEYLIAASEIRKALHPSEVNRIISKQFSDSRLNEISVSSRKIMENRMQLLAKGPWAGIITTNYDTLIERGLSTWRAKPVISVLTQGGDLGLALNRTGAEEIFFVKIHGTINTGHVVLSSEEYEDAYFKTSKISNFLISAMMSYNFVFLGSSIEAEILRIRQRLCADYDSGVPIAYALMPRSEMNVRKSRWLKENARIQVLFYPEGHHEALDELLAEFIEIDRIQTARHFPNVSHIATIRSLDTQEAKREAIGTMNLSIVRYVQDACFGVITKEQVLRMADYPDLPDELAKMSRDEFFYRVLFLIGSGLMSESEVGGKTVYEIEP
jgi:hypothetical protein